MKNHEILVMGDIHRSFGDLNGFLNKHSPEIILQCGDFGYWPREPIKEIYGRNNPKYPKDRPMPKVKDGTQLFWCDGNHEDHQELGLRETDELWPNVHYMPRGSLLDLPDGRRVMFMGGAQSVDRHTRTFGIDWFPEEVISYADVHNIEYEGPVDIVVSHTCPREFDIGIGHKEEGYYKDCSRMALSYILHHYRPSLWYFGHWHHYKTAYESKYGCRWTALNYPGNGKWWATLKA
jgi:hypothetical protein